MPFNNFAHHLTLMGNIAIEAPKDFDPAKFQFTIELQDGRKQEIFVGKTTSFQVVQNLDNVSMDRVPEPTAVGAPEDQRAYSIRKYIQSNNGSLIVAIGVYQEHEGRSRYDARAIYLMDSRPGRYAFEETHWWLTQISRLGDQWLDQLFDDKRDYTFSDFAELYKTNLNITGMPTDDNAQETATLSRLLYGLSSAYLLTGSERFLLAARAGVQFQRETFRHLSHDGQYCFWAFGRKRRRYITELYETSQNGDDLNTIPLYEQIYALAGLTQYYRITQDWRVLEDIRRTVRAFNDFYLDGRKTDPTDPNPKQADGYFSHLDYVTMRPDADVLGQNKARKNWNSIGDHLPAYMINLILALEPLPKGRDTDDLAEFLEKCKWMLEHTSSLICEHFSDDSSKYVNERFDRNWNPDHEWGWQQNRAIVGHNLKIAWNLTRVANYYRSLAQASPAEAEQWNKRAGECTQLATRLADDMAEVGVDQIRGGCFDAVERNPVNGMPLEFAWSSTKDFWQQEQAILAYLILQGASPKPEYKALARRMMAFWNLFFLDHDYNGIYFRVSDDGIPITSGAYGIKGGHAMAGYHSFELNYLAHLYIRTFVSPKELGQEQNFVLYFRPDTDCRQTSINVLPDFLPPGAVHLKSVTVAGKLRTGQLPKNFQIDLAPDELGSMVIAEFQAAPPAAEKAEQTGE